jgi:hypothetical protein
VAPGIRDRIDLWFAVSGRARWRPVKRAAQLGMRAIKGLSGMTVTPSLALALKKRS